MLGLIKEGCVISMENDIFPVLIRKKKLSGFVTGQRFYDIGTPERLKKFRRVLNDYFPNAV